MQFEIDPPPIIPPFKINDKRRVREAPRLHIVLQFKMKFSFSGATFSKSIEIESNKLHGYIWNGRTSDTANKICIWIYVKHANVRI